jgi:methylthioribulose-1-phosphate dehydratase
MSDPPSISSGRLPEVFYQLGWMLGTAGNLSAKVDDHSFWITASGKSKGKLTEEDFVTVEF